MTLVLTQSLVDSFSSRMSDQDAAKELNVSLMGFFKARKRYNIPSFFERTGNRKRKNGEFYSFMNYNERYFQKIDSFDKAYFLGLMASDGNISPRLTAARIALKEEDSLILEKFRSFLGDDSPKLKTKIQRYKNGISNPQKSLVLSRKALVKDLMGYGIVPNKSKDLVMQVDLGDYVVDFLRGVWDGDGSVSERRFKVTTASKDFALQLQEWIHEVSDIKLPIKLELTKQNSDLYHIAGYVRDAKVIQKIYGGSTLYIERKMKSYLQYWEPRR